MKSPVEAKNRRESMMVAITNSVCRFGPPAWDSTAKEKLQARYDIIAGTNNLHLRKIQKKGIAVKENIATLFVFFFLICILKGL